MEDRRQDSLEDPQQAVSLHLRPTLRPSASSRALAPHSWDGARPTAPTLCPLLIWVSTAAYTQNISHSCDFLARGTTDINYILQAEKYVLYLFVSLCHTPVIDLSIPQISTEHR